MTGTGTQIETISKGSGLRPVSRVLSSVASLELVGVRRADDTDNRAAADSVHASRRGDGRNRAPAFLAADPHEPVRHLVIFSAPVL